MKTVMPADPDYYLDIEGIEEEPPRSRAGPRTGRKWIGVDFECCGVYARIYRNKTATAYEGHCPKCGRRVRVAIGPGGTSHRLFRAK